MKQLSLSLDLINQKVLISSFDRVQCIIPKESTCSARADRLCFPALAPSQQKSKCGGLQTHLWLDIDFVSLLSWNNKKKISVVLFQFHSKSVRLWR